MSQLRLLVYSMVLWCCSTAWGQVPGATPPPATPGAPGVRRDPTAASPRLRAALETPNNRPTSTPGGPPIWVPQITLKARVLLPGKPSLALIEVDKRLHLVRQGSELNLMGERGGMVVLLVEAVDRTEVRILMSPLNQLLTLR